MSIYNNIFILLYRRNECYLNIKDEVNVKISSLEFLDIVALVRYIVDGIF